MTKRPRLFFNPIGSIVRVHAYHACHNVGQSHSAEMPSHSPYSSMHGPSRPAWAFAGNSFQPLAKVTTRFTVFPEAVLSGGGRADCDGDRPCMGGLQVDLVPMTVYRRDGPNVDLAWKVRMHRHTMESPPSRVFAVAGFRVKAAR